MTTPRYTTATVAGLLVANPLVEQPAVTFAQLPSAASAAGRPPYRVTDIGPVGHGSLWVSNGTRWSPLGGRLILKTLGNPVSGIANSETIPLQVLLPAGAWQVNDTLRFWYSLTKSGTTDSLTRTTRIGTAGTTADASIEAGSALGATSQTGGFITDLKLLSATTVGKMGSGTAGNSSYTTASATGEPGAVTISSAVSNALYASLTIKSSSTNDTVGIQSGQIELITP